jgi:hypothetical protein
LTDKPLVARWVQIVFGLGFVAMIILSIAGPVSYVLLSSKINEKAEAACADVNDVREGIQAYVTGAAERSRAALEARVANPEAHEEEIAQAQENLAQLEAQLAELNETFALNECD